MSCSLGFGRVGVPISRFRISTHFLFCTKNEFLKIEFELWPDHEYGLRGAGLTTQHSSTNSDFLGIDTSSSLQVLLSDS